MGVLDFLPGFGNDDSAPDPPDETPLTRALNKVNPASPYRPGQSRVGAPVMENLPNLQKGFVKKWGGLSKHADRFDPDVIDAIQRMDLDQIRQGKNQLTVEETANALRAAQERIEVTRPRERSTTDVFGNIIGDIKDIGLSIPHLLTPTVNNPLIQEALAIPRELPEALASGDLGEIAGAPGVRMLPGAYVAENILEGTPEELARHPLFTALDVAPIANQISKGTKVGKLAVAEKKTIAGLPEEVAERARVNPEDIVTKNALQAEKGIIGPVRHSTANVFRKIGKNAKGDEVLIRNKAGRLVDNLSENTMPGRELTRAFGKEVRTVSQLALQFEQILNTGATGNLSRVSPALKENPVFAPYRRMLDLHEGAALKEYGVTAERIPEITSMLRRNTDDIGKLLPENEIAFAQEIMDVERVFREAGYTAKKLAEHGGETYLFKHAAKLNKAKDKIARKKANLDENWMADRVWEKGPLKGQYRGSKIMEMVAKANDTRMQELMDAVAEGDWKLGRKKMNSMRKQRVDPSGRGMSDVWDPLIQRSVALDSLDGLYRELGDLVDAEKAYAKKLRKAKPARWDDVVEDYAAGKIQEKALEKLAREQGEQAVTSGPTVQQVIQDVIDRNYKATGLSDDVIMSIKQEADRNWQAIAAESGQNPMYYHRVPVSEAERVNQFKLSPQAKVASMHKERGLFETAGVNDATISMAAQGKELLHAQYNDLFIDRIIDEVGMSKQSLMTSLEPQVAAAMKYAAPGTNSRTVMQDLLNSGAVEFDPTGLGFTKSARVLGTGDDAIMIPRSVADALKQQAKGPNMLDVALAPAMKMFRTNVLALAPRWQINNVGGNTIIAGVEDPLIFKHYLDAHQSIKALKTGGKAADKLSEEMRASLNGLENQLRSEYQFMAGNTIGRMYENFMSKQKVLSQARDIKDKVVHKSYNANVWFDDTQRIAAAFRGRDVAAKNLFGVDDYKKLTRDQMLTVDREAMAYARKVTIGYDNMTPFEQSVIRSVLPFYSFQQLLTRFVVNYPLDHPFRMEIMSTLARQEKEAKEGLSGNMLDAMFIGAQKDGKQRAVKFGGFNPFGDSSSLFTMAGFMSRTNPLIGATLKSLGFDSMSGQAELFPDLEYDPENGYQLTSPGFVGSVVEGFIPQTRLLKMITGQSADFNEAAKRDPASARRMLLTGAGIPTMYREYDLNLERAKEQTRRSKAQKLAKSKAVKTGDDSDANRYPELRPYIKQLRDLQATNPQALQGFTPPVSA